jgi:hypothetical protein
MHTITGLPDDVTPETGVSLVEHAFEMAPEATPPKQWSPYVQYSVAERGDAAAMLADAIRFHAPKLTPIERAALARELLPEVADYLAVTR